MTSDWLPGLPDHPCVCDVRVFGRIVMLSAKIEFEEIDDRLTDAKAFIQRNHEWRPITVPEGA